ncbi:MAG: aldehyde dehydrogenase family protein [Thermomicrobiales bacterium]|jgi:aldehyde dehydrogenase (NAD+)|nr:aldehyde dehydrogenase family protein [Thermomicrobiales bacterium]
MSVTTYQNYIGGEWVAAKSGETFESRSPADADVLLGRFAASGAVDVDAAVTAASDARASWRRTSAIARANILHKAAEILASRVNDVGRELTIEEGKTLKEGIGETGRAVQILRYYAGEAQQPDGEHYPSANPNTLLYTMREPVGVVGVITPWNFPIAIPAWKIAPALAFGNTVVFKPATYTPLLAVRFVEALAEAGLPPGVVNLVTGSSGGVGDPLIDDDRVTAISFTGSEPVGRSVAKRISARGGKVQLELGGKNPAIVFADADLDHAVNHLVSGAMWSSGQKCTATSRALLDASIADEVTRRLTERIGNLATGDPLADSTQVGPVISDEAVKRILGDIESAESEGARLLAGGSKLEGDGRERGNFVAPTLFGEMNPDSRFGQEEVFGPVLGITTVKDMDEALEIANSVRFGLSASIFTSDLGKAMHFINGIDAGIVHVNAETPGAEPQVPFGGYKSSSSYSREQGKSARDFYTQIKTVYVDLPSPA